MNAAALALALLSMPDAKYLAWQARAHGIDPRVVLAIAWEETRRNTDPSVRGQAGETGRFQLSRATAKHYCPAADIRLYHANVACALRLMAQLQARHDIPGLLPIHMIRRYNGAGPKAEAYTARVLRSVAALR